MRIRRHFNKYLFTLLVATSSATLTLCAQTAKPAPQTPKKGKLVINQDSEVSTIVNNKSTAPASTTPQKPKTEKPTKPSEKNTKSEQEKTKGESTTSPTKQEKKNDSTVKTKPAEPKTTESKKETETKKPEVKKEVGSSSEEHVQETRDAATIQAEKAAEQRAALERERAKERKERAEEVDKGYHAGMIRTRYKAKGFRIQIYTGGNTRNHKSQAYAIAGKSRQVAPELGTYVQFQSPHWICRVGDFRNREDANRYARRLRSAGVSNESRVVNCEVLLAN